MSVFYFQVRYFTLLRVLKRVILIYLPVFECTSNLSTSLFKIQILNHYFVHLTASTLEKLKIISRYNKLSGLWINFYVEEKWMKFAKGCGRALAVSEWVGGMYLRGVVGPWATSPRLTVVGYWSKSRGRPLAIPWAPEERDREAGRKKDRWTPTPKLKYLGKRPSVLLHPPPQFPIPKRYRVKIDLPIETTTKSIQFDATFIYFLNKKLIKY